MAIKKMQIINQGMPSGLSVREAVMPARVPRKPRHPFNIIQYPYELTPFMIAPVLAGETMRNLLLQCRTVSTPLENRLIGHHLEHYFFYVKLRDLADQADIVEMLMDNGTNVNVNGGDVEITYVKSGSPRWLGMCVDAITTAYFRDQGDTGSHVGSVTSLPMVQWTNYQSVFESLIADASIETDTTADTVPYPDQQKEYQTWKFLYEMQMTEASFEDYLGTFGVKTNDADEDRPELIRFCKNWTYPTNTVDGDGTINTQVSWSVQERADKDRFFKEPGFIVGVSVARPKLYMGLQTQSAVGMLNDALSWMPAIMKDQVHSSMRKLQGNAANFPISAASSPTGGGLDSDLSYWFDLRDLFLYGDQFINRAAAADVNNAIRAEDMATFHGKKYPQSAALQTIGKNDTLTYESDGMVSLNILGTQLDAT